MKYTDETLMPFGKYEGQKLCNVPAEYLIYLHDNKIAKDYLKEYIEDNMDVLKFEMRISKTTNISSDRETDMV